QIDYLAERVVLERPRSAIRVARTGQKVSQSVIRSSRLIPRRVLDQGGLPEGVVGVVGLRNAIGIGQDPQLTDHVHLLGRGVALGILNGARAPLIRVVGVFERRIARADRT